MKVDFVNSTRNYFFYSEIKMQIAYCRAFLLVSERKNIFINTHN